MPDISKIVLPEVNTVYDIRDAKKSGVYSIIGTQTATTNQWTGDIPISALYDGLTINYYLPYAGTSTAATLNLTLADGTTTGPINCYLHATARLTTHFGAGRTFIMTYYSAGSVSAAGVPTTDDRWTCDGYYDTNDVGTIRPTYSRILAGGNGLTQYGLFARISDGTYSSFTTDSGTGAKTMDTSHYFDPIDIWYHNSTTNLASGSYTGNSAVDFEHNLVDLRYSFNDITTKAATSILAAKMPTYIVFDKSLSYNGYYKLKSPYITQTPNDTGALYTLIAYTYDTYRSDLWVNNPVFTYNGTSLVPFTRETSEVSEIWLEGTLSSGATSLTLQDVAITSNSLVDFYASTFGIYPTNATVTTGAITLTFSAQSSDVNIKVKILEVPINAEGWVMGTLTAGSTSLTLQNANINSSSNFDFYTDTFGVYPTGKTVTTGSITLTFTAQQSDVLVKARIF